MFLSSLDAQGRVVDYPGVIFRELLSKVRVCLKANASYHAAREREYSNM